MVVVDVVVVDPVEVVGVVEVAVAKKQPISGIEKLWILYKENRYIFGKSLKARFNFFFGRNPAFQFLLQLMKN